MANGAHLSEWSDDLSLMTGDTQCLFTGLNTKYAYDIYVDCDDDQTPPSIISTKPNPASVPSGIPTLAINNGGTDSMLVEFTEIKSGENDGSKFKLRIVK